MSTKIKSNHGVLFLYCSRLSTAPKMFSYISFRPVTKSKHFLFLSSEKRQRVILMIGVIPGMLDNVTTAKWFSQSEFCRTQDMKTVTQICIQGNMHQPCAGRQQAG
jgi:hypothetical protein